MNGFGVMTKILEGFIPEQRCESQRASSLYVMLGQMLQQISALDLGLQV